MNWWRGAPLLDRVLLIIVVLCLAGVLFGVASIGMIAAGG